jgi:D-2-hydroxyacid dehydrogenase (NADP+)
MRGNYCVCLSKNSKGRVPRALPVGIYKLLKEKMMLNLLILERRAEEFRKALQPKFPELTIYSATKEEDVGEVIEKIDILLVLNISDGLLKKASKLQWIQFVSSGMDKLSKLPSLRKEVIVTSSKGIHGPQGSEMAFLLMLALNRNFPQIVRNQDQKIWERWPGKLLYRKKVGILGVGVIGEEIARKCKAFGMTVFGINRTKKQVDAVDYFHGPEELLHVIKEVDYFIIAAPNTPETKKMVGARELSFMKPTAFLINIGRGAIVDEDALLYALKNGKIAGAALDAFCEEPLPKDHPFWEVKNLIITPHLGGVSDIWVEQALPIVEENLRRFLKGERRNLINLIEL